MKGAKKVEQLPPWTPMDCFSVVSETALVCNGLPCINRYLVVSLLLIPKRLLR